MNVLIISDFHAPYNHPDAVDFLSDLKKLHKPDVVVGIGDTADFHRLSTHPQSPDMPGPAEELRMAREALRPLYKLFPKVKVCVGNHEARVAKRASDASLPSECRRSLGEILDAPDGWEWADSWDVDGIHFRHGDGFSGKNAALTAAEKIRKRVVIGHVHSVAGVQYSAGFYDTIWGLATACLIDTNHAAFSYAKHQASRPVLGTGLIIDGVPIFVPL